ncbi:MoaD/ThiS family protein [Thermococcus sp. MV5]|uniref:ubiquitin-like small modifier protein 1 n=1 Tax=Thermococcus sp. MV5 TaxID=1638272 RepID=UPI0014390939|nr:ubiquitin-like small modifier protein 1 [Thermococcus sp. MV5]NJE26242.1 MoaD/ThiS family protein [Thermococcus sp. MV5]
MKVKVRYFARFREISGVNEEIIELSEGSKVSDLIEHIKNLHPELKKEVFGEDYDDEADVNVSRNGRYASFDEMLEDGDVIALFPPTSGG